SHPVYLDKPWGRRHRTGDIMTNLESEPSNPFAAFFTGLIRSWLWPVIVFVYIAIVTYGVRESLGASPWRVLLWRILFLSGLLLIYYMPQPIWLKLMFGVVVCAILVPYLGVRSPFLLELGFQICLYSTLALGLNIVVGFSGLLDLGYIAF